MHDVELHRWQHDHSFGQHVKRPGEARTLLVIAITATMMVVEIAAGIVFGSMALLADGLHMASHAAALSINAFAYVYARRHAHDASYCFGTGKINTLGGFTGAVLLAGFALLMATESIERLVAPVAIAFNQAIFVAVLGLIVNGISVLILGHGHDHGDRDHGRHDHDHDHDDGDHGDDHGRYALEHRNHGRGHGPHEHAGHEHEHLGHEHGHHGHHHHQDHNLISAYLHVLADALTSLLAIFALLGAKYFGLHWMDPLMGIVGSILVARWSIGLLKTTSVVLLDKSAPAALRETIRTSIERGDTRIADLHVWSVGPGIYSALLSVVTHDPKPPEHYKALLPTGIGLVHVAVEVHACASSEPSSAVQRSAVS